MSWFYAENGKHIGPVDDGEWASLISSGRIGPETLVWRNGMTDWLPFAQVPAAQPAPATVAASPLLAGGALVECSECHRSFPDDDVVTIGNRPVCAGCKPIVVQKLAEGGLLLTDQKYAGFWIRAGAKVIDGIILYAVSQGVALVAGLITGSGQDQQAATVLAIVLVGFNLLVSLAYQAGFLGRYGATPGKMACGLKVIRADGSPITYARGAGRYFAEILSAMILYIGYIMVAFDDEKRALHDRVCDTRVVRK